MDKQEQLKKMKEYMLKEFNITPENIDEKLRELKGEYKELGLIK